jgi:DNA repair protein RecO (recombination protein O)
MVNSRTTPAVVLRWRAYGESDKVVTFLTKDFGKITGIGKGARNSKRRFPNSLEILARVHVQFRQRAEASLAFLESCQLTSPNTATWDAERLAYGAYLAELAEQMTVEWNPAAEIYDLLVEALASLDTGPATAAFVRAYELQLLERAGFASPLDHCHQCGVALGANAESYFNPAHGTFVCNHCHSSGEGLLAVPTQLLARLRSLRRAPLSDCRKQPLGEGRQDVARLTGQLLALHLVRPLKSTRMIEQLIKGERS